MSVSTKSWARFVRWSGAVRSHLRETKQDARRVKFDDELYAVLVQICMLVELVERLVGGDVHALIAGPRFFRDPLQGVREEIRALIADYADVVPWGKGGF